ncbi:MAG: hypothetical protein JSV19_12950 [Phycisphaerales bacterium]|nr:MAG: hypothetical protein JSV19_12950 [Phycisphaerales bacterium]
MDEKGRADAKHQAKQAKKLAKAQVKREKKGEKLGADVDKPAPVSIGVVPSATKGERGHRAGLTPAERSARAAERSVRLTGYRVWIAAVTLLIAIVTALVTWLNYTYSSSAPAPASDNPPIGAPASSEASSQPRAPVP